jgi:SH3-like domain-containing protein
MPGRKAFLIVSFLLAVGITVCAAAPSATRAASDDGAKTTTHRVERPGRTGLPLPRFVSLRSDEINMRTGPGLRYPILWVYHRRNLPVEIIDEFDTWRRIRDWQGTIGWVHQSMVQGHRTALVIDQDRILRREPDDGSAAVARLKRGAIGSLEECRDSWCRTDFNGFDGWLRRDEFYGTYPNEGLE